MFFISVTCRSAVHMLGRRYLQQDTFDDSSFHRSINAVFGKVGRLASEEVTLQLAKKSKCIPVLICGLKCFTPRKADVKSLAFVVIRFLMKLFNSANTDVINNCRWYSDFELPSEVLAKRVPNLRGNLLTIKTCIVTLAFVRSS